MAIIKAFEVIIFLIKFFVTIAFFIPSIFVYLAYSYIIPPIITFVIMCYFAKKVGSNRAIIYNVITHLFMLGTTISMYSNPGTDDSFSNLDKVINSVVYASFFTLAAFIFFIIYIVAVLRVVSKNRAINNPPKEPSKPVQTVEIKYLPKFNINNRQKGIILLTIAIVLILIGGGIIVNSYMLKYRTIRINNEKIMINKYKDEIYCTGGMCFIYNGKRMELYEDEDESEGSYLDYFYGEYRIRNNKLYDENPNCKYSEIIKWNKNNFTLKCGDRVIHYYNAKGNYPNYDYEGESKSDLTGKAYKNKSYELYFLTDNVMLFGTSTKKCALRYELKSTGDEYYDFRAEHYSNDNCDGLTKGLPKTFNNNTKELLGYKKVSLDKIKNIDKNYFNETDKSKYLIEGYFQGHYGYYYLKGNTLTKEADKKTYNVEVVYAYNDFIYYKNSDNSNYPTFYYNKKEDKLCEAGQICYERINK